MTYREVKGFALEYRRAKNAARGPSGPFSGWLCSPEPLEAFTQDAPESRYQGSILHHTGQP